MYITQQQVEDEFSAPRLLNALDDDGDGNPDDGLLDRIIAAAQLAVDGFLAGRYITPLSPVPQFAQEATLIFVCEKIYERRRQGTDEKNPYTTRANDFRQELKDIADRKKSLDARERPAFVPGAIISRKSKINASTT